jgi:phage terminase Nu1 subunit (DNA packaging protein)
MTVDQPTLAELFGVTTRTIQRWGRQGLDEARVGDSATYDLRAAIAWREAQLKGDDPLTEARVRKMEADAERSELRTARERGELIHVDDLEMLFAEPLAMLRARLLELPARIAVELPMPDREAVDIIEPLVHALMTEMAEAGDLEPHGVGS